MQGSEWWSEDQAMQINKEEGFDTFAFKAAAICIQGGGELDDIFDPMDSLFKVTREIADPSGNALRYSSVDSGNDWSILMETLFPLESLYDVSRGPDLPLPENLARLYGRLGFPSHADRPHVISNFVATLDGVVSLGMKDKTDGDHISGFNQHDSMVMALLRAASDAIIVGAGSLRKSSQHIWTAEYVYPSLAEEFQELRRSLGMERFPLNVFITGSGNIDPGLPVFHVEGLPIAIVTTLHGAEEVKKRGMPGHVQIIAPSSASHLTVPEMLAALSGLLRRNKLIMTEGGPHILGEFLAEGCLDELFLTVAPQVAGRDGHLERMGLVEGRIFSPDHSVWAKLLSLRRAGEHLFLRYQFNVGEPQGNSPLAPSFETRVTAKNPPSLPPSLIEREGQGR